MKNKLSNKQASKADVEKLIADCLAAGWEDKTDPEAYALFGIRQFSSPVSAWGQFAIVTVNGRSILSTISYNGGKSFRGLFEARRALANMTEELASASNTKRYK